MQVKTIVLEVDDVTIAGRLCLPDGQAPYLIVGICHGIPARVPDHGDPGYALLAERICREGMAAFIFNFRGTGLSGGNFDIRGWTRDLEGVLEYLWALPEVDRSRLSLLGFSGGAAVSIYVASRDRRISLVVSCACPAEFKPFVKPEDSESLIAHFRSIGVFRDEGFPYSIEDWVDSFRLVSPIEYVAGISPRALLLVHGSQDDLVDVANARRLYNRAGKPKELAIVDGAGHRLRHDDGAMAIVIEWLKSKSQLCN